MIINVSLIHNHMSRIFHDKFMFGWSEAMFSIFSDVIRFTGGLCKMHKAPTRHFCACAACFVGRRKLNQTRVAWNERKIQAYYQSY